MTWKEFKDYVEANGAKDDDEILSIDTAAVEDAAELGVRVEDSQGRRSIEIWG